MKRTIGITGSNGFIGWHLSNFLSLDVENFIVIKFPRSCFDDNSDIDSYVNKCDIIIHLAAINRHENDNYIYEKNIELANNLINSLTRTKFKGHLIFSSSIHELKDNTFGKSKKKARELFSEWSENNNTLFSGLLIPNVFGAFGLPFYNSVISTFCHQLIFEQKTQVETDIKLNLLYIDDLIKIITEIIENKNIGIINIEYTNTYKVSELLNILLQFKIDYIEKGEIPLFHTQFHINLFNTFRSYIDMENRYPVSYKNNTDCRGNFVEIVKLKCGGQISFSTTNIGVTRGEHFHTRKIERFTVIKGNALIKLRKKNDSKIFQFYLSGEEPSYVDMPIWFTHNITNIGKDDLYTIFWINEYYDSNDSDTYFEKV
jgi:UDP-2-acetamido-2,6-beta-L-arabino-hexul-4-ose reductase